MAWLLGNYDQLLSAAWEHLTLPLALPVIVAGLRVAAVTVIGIATVAACISAGGLGALIFSGIAQTNGAKIAAGAGLASLMAVLADWGLR